jgi:hypothetical protein
MSTIGAQALGLEYNGDNSRYEQPSFFTSAFLESLIVETPPSSLTDEMPKYGQLALFEDSPEDALQRSNLGLVIELANNTSGQHSIILESPNGELTRTVEIPGENNRRMLDLMYGYLGTDKGGFLNYTVDFEDGSHHRSVVVTRLGVAVVESLSVSGDRSCFSVMAIPADLAIEQYCDQQLLQF